MLRFLTNILTCLFPSKRYVFLKLKFKYLIKFYQYSRKHFILKWKRNKYCLNAVHDIRVLNEFEVQKIRESKDKFKIEQRYNEERTS